MQIYVYNCECGKVTVSEVVPKTTPCQGCGTFNYQEMESELMVCQEGQAEPLVSQMNVNPEFERVADDSVIVESPVMN